MRLPPLTIGSFSLDGQSATWGQRGPGIGALLRQCALDVYLLQEVSATQMEELGPALRANYEIVHFSYAEPATGGAAVLLRKSRLALMHKVNLPFWAKGDVPRCFMCAAIAFARDLASGAQLVIASAHCDPRNVEPEKDLLVYLRRVRKGRDATLLKACPELASIDAAVWGGPAPRPLTGAAVPAGYLTAAPAEYERTGVRSGRGKSVFVFASEDVPSVRRAGTGGGTGWGGGRAARAPFAPQTLTRARVWGYEVALRGVGEGGQRRSAPSRTFDLEREL